MISKYTIIDSLKNEEVVVIPTETVYGLAGDGCSTKAITQIYKLKKRPHTNPLIVHSANINILQQYVKWHDTAQLLAEHFWPGPMTFVLPLISDKISPLVTAGKTSLAVRIPNHNLCREILEEFGGIVAAPSANPSQYISPTTIEHVRKCLEIMQLGQLNYNVNYIDGGPCKEGLESTIIDLRDENNINILRSGPITEEQITALINKNLKPQYTTELIAPGMMKRHYCPKYKLQLNVTNSPDNHPLIAFGSVLSKAKHTINLSEDADLSQAAHNLFNAMYTMEHMLAINGYQLETTVVNVSPIPNDGIGRAINDRLKRAATK